MLSNIGDFEYGTQMLKVIVIYHFLVQGYKKLIGNTENFAIEDLFEIYQLVKNVFDIVNLSREPPIILFE